MAYRDSAILALTRIYRCFLVLLPKVSPKVKALRPSHKSMGIYPIAPRGGFVLARCSAGVGHSCQFRGGRAEGGKTGAQGSVLNVARFPIIPDYGEINLRCSPQADQTEIHEVTLFSDRSMRLFGTRPWSETRVRSCIGQSEYVWPDRCVGPKFVGFRSVQLY